MADTKITALTAISTVDPAVDVLPIVDVSDTTMAASGTTKKITSNQILGAGGTATLASATISGDLTVDTSTLKVDSANNRVGVLTASPQYPFHVVGTDATNVLFAGVTKGIRFTQSASTSIITGVDNTGGVSFQPLSIGGSALDFSLSGSTAMTLNSTGLGVGGSPTSKLSIFANSDGDVGFFRGGSTRQLQIGTSATAGYLNTDNASAGFELRTNGVARAYFDNAGNLGLGVTPSAWNSSYRALQVGATGALWQSASGFTFLSDNAFVNSGASNTYITTAAASFYRQTSGIHSWWNAPSGTAGTAITFTQAMTLDASGNLLVGTTTANGRVAVDADLAVYNGMSVKNTGTTYGASSFFFRFINSSGATAGSIQHTAVTTTNYSTASDARLKESKGIATDTSVIDNTVIHDFIWKADGSVDRGVFAQEAQSVKPRAVSAGSDDLTEDGNIKTPWSVDYSKYVPDLIVYCQQLKKQVKELTARVQTLEAK